MNELKDLFADENLNSNEGKKSASESLRKLREYGNAEGVMKMLATNPNAGIAGDDRDLRRRTMKFKKNKKPKA